MTIATRAEIEALFERRRIAWNEHDVMGITDTHTVDGVIKSPMFGELYGRAQIEASYEKLFRTFPDWTFADEPLIIDGNRVVEIAASTATHSAEFMGIPATGRHFKVEGTRLYTIRDGLVHEEQRLYDFTSLLIQVGVLKGKPGA